MGLIQIALEWVQKVGALDLVGLPGVIVLALWLLRTGLGRRSLASAPIRRNCLTYHCLAAFLVWLIPPVAVMHLLKRRLAGLAPWQAEFAINIVAGAGAVAVIPVALAVGKRCFARGLKGLGLAGQRVGRDLAASLVNFLAILSVFLAVVQVTVWVGHLIHGPEYQMDRHKELKLLIEYPHWPLRLSIILLGVLIAPVVEELLFRGLVQSTLRAYLGSPWAVVAVCGLIFATIHQNVEHWPALFVLGVGMGYAYERSGSLWRPIFIHVMFNGLTVLSQMVQPT